MGRGFLIVALGFGAVAGFVAGGAHLIHGCRHHGHFADRVADTCTEAAYRVWGEHAHDTAASPPAVPR